MMSWEKQPREPREIMEASQQNGNVNGNGNSNGNGNGVLYVKVMTDEQLETLRKQIAVYSTICEQLVDMHKNLTAQQDLAGARLGNLYCDPLMTSGSHKISARQRWTPTPMQLQILERIFEQGNGTPSKQKIKEITSELGQHGQISETNVYNWFQNRRARSKRKQQNAGPNNAESEVETEVESPKDKKTKPEEFHSQHNSSALRPLEDVCLQSAEIRNLQHSLDQQTSKAETMFPSNVGLRTTRNMSPVSSSYYDDLLSNLRNDHMVGKMELPSSYFCDIGEEYNMNMSD